MYYIYVYRNKLVQVKMNEIFRTNHWCLLGNISLMVVCMYVVLCLYILAMLHACVKDKHMSVIRLLTCANKERNECLCNWCELFWSQLTKRKHILITPYT